MAKNKKTSRVRVHPRVIAKVVSPNQSERTDVPRLIVLHSTESHNIPKSNTDLYGVANWFKNPASQASSHVVVDGDGNSIRCVSDTKKAWTCVAYNSLSLNIEQVGIASLGWWEWRKQWRELRETARWIARWSLEYGIPIERTGASGTGVVTHADLGAAGGGHTDPGKYPMKRVLWLARQYKKRLSK